MLSHILGKYKVIFHCLVFLGNIESVDNEGMCMTFECDGNEEKLYPENCNNRSANIHGLCGKCIAI